MRFVFEKNLNHQTSAVESIIGVFKNLKFSSYDSYFKDYINPIINLNSISYLQNIQKLNPQFILRFGATFEDDKNGNKKFENLIYTLTAAETFNHTLVKGVIAHIEKNESGKNTLI